MNMHLFAHSIAREVHHLAQADRRMALHAWRGRYHQRQQWGQVLPVENGRTIQLLKEFLHK